MELETKKRIRPTWAMIRSLQDKIAEHVTKTNEWMVNCQKASSENDVLRGENERLKRDNCGLRDANIELIKQNDRLCDEIYRLEKRGIIERIFNL